MSNAAHLQLIDSIAREGAARGLIFSAHDIVRAAWQRGVVLNVGDVNGRVQVLVQAGALADGYTWSSTDLGLIVFHRLGDDPRQYKLGSGPTIPRGQSFWTWIWNTLFGEPETPSLSSSAIPSRNMRQPEPPPIPFPHFPPQGENVQTRLFDPLDLTRQPPEQQWPERPEGKKLGLDAAQFLPISRAELKDRAGNIERWQLFAAVRRDLIPPATDERTILIDRGMVSTGLLSPEQLAEIHRVGAEMDLVRPDIQNVRQLSQQAGAAAVEEDRAFRAAEKAKKKEEAARRKEARAADIAHRKEHDIVYLGRGVSVRLGQRESNLEKLQQLGLPLLSTPVELATALQITVRQLRWLAFHTDVAARTHYIHFTIPKKNGGLRTLSAPHRKLAAAQKWILRTILDKLPMEPNAQGFVKGKNILTNASQHVGQQVVINTDLENFFPSISFPRVRSVFQRCGYSPAVASILALLCTEAPRKQVQYAGQTYFVALSARALPQGACTSPALSNQVARRLDKRLQGIATKLNLAYTRYADDLTFSGNDELKERVGYVMARIRHIAQDEGFAVNEAKTRILRRNAAQEVTGLVVNDRPGVPRKEVRRLRAILHGARKTGLAAQNREGRTHFHSWLQGMISFVAMSQPEVGGKMRAELQELLTREVN